MKDINELDRLVEKIALQFPSTSNAIQSNIDIGAIPLFNDQMLYVFNFFTGEITYVRNSQSFLGINEDDFNYTSISSNIHPNEVWFFKKLLQVMVPIVLKGGGLKDWEKFTVKYRMKRRGEYRNILRQTIVHEFNEQGQLASNLSILTDITDLNPSKEIQWSVVGSEEIKNWLREELRNKNSIDFTNRELQVLEQLAEGKSSNEIAKELYLSKHTVDTHRRNLLKKSNCHNSVELVAFGKLHGLV